MGLNNDGFNGIDIEQIALEKAVFVGVQAPNVFPSVAQDKNKKSLPSLTLTNSAGAMVLGDSGYDCRYVDNSWLSHGGNYSLTVGNKIYMNTGAGGFETVCTGPWKLKTPYQDLIAENCFQVETKLFRVGGSERMQLNGKRFDATFDDIYLRGNVKVVNNMVVNGGLFINGETYIRHFTTQGERHDTLPCDGIDGYLNPAQSFIVFDGKSAFTEAHIRPHTNAASYSGQLPDTPAYIDVVIAIPFPPPISQVINLPCKIAFPNGISLLSDGMATAAPDTLALLTAGDQRPKGGTVQKSDFYGPGHMHKFIGPSCQWLDDSGKVLEEVKNKFDTLQPISAKASVPNGCASITEVGDMIMNAAQNSVKDWLKNLWVNHIKPW